MGLQVGMMDGHVEIHHALQERDGFVGSSFAVTDLCDVEQSNGLPAAVAHRAKERQRLLIILQGARLLPQIAMDTADVVERGGLPAAVAHRAKERQRLLIILQGARLLPQIAMDMPML